MFEVWIPATIASAFLRNLRNALQKDLTGALSTAGATATRFAYALPVAALAFAGLCLAEQAPALQPGPRFFGFCLLGGVSQAFGTLFLLRLYGMRSFAVGATFCKLDVLAIALLGALLLGDALGVWAWFAIGLSLLGVLLLSATRARLNWEGLARGVFQKATGVGLLCALFFGAGAVFFRGASLALELPREQFLFSAGFTLLVCLALQTFLMCAYLALREAPQLLLLAQNWRRAGAVGLCGALASLGWFVAFTLQNAAYVGALGQIELLFGFLSSVFVFKERATRNEILGIALVAAGIILLLLAPAG